MNGKKLLLDNSYIDYIKKIINVLLRKVMREDGKIKVKHIDLEDMPSSSVADHDGRYFTKSEHKATSAGVADAGKPIKLNASGLVDNTMIEQSFLDLTDTPSDYDSQSGKLVAVNSGETALEFIDMPTDLNDKVKISENDTTTAYLGDKLDAGSGISLTVLNEGVNEQISVSNSDTGSGAVSAHEGTYDHSLLHSPVSAGTGISVVGQEVSNSDTGSGAVSGHESTYDHTKLHDPATVADTNSIDMTITGQEIKADVRTQNSTTVDLSIDGSGLKADLNSTLKTNYDTAYSNTHASGSDNQNLWETITADTGTTTADSQTDTLSIVGAGTVSTSITGDTLTITGSGGADTDEKVKVNSDDITAGYLEDKLTAGTGISLTPAVDDSDITIANTDTGSGAVGSHESTYNHSNYNTAYGWGDHSAAGYFVKSSDDLDDITAGTTNVHLTTTLKTAYDGAVSASHSRQHNIDSTSDHTGISGATENNFLSANANGLPKDSGKKASDFANASHNHTASDLPTATTSDLGVASFDTNNFSVSSGAVSIKNGGVDLTTEIIGTLPVGNGGTGLTSYTDKALFYADGTGTLAQTKVYYDKTDEQVGIGTDAPTRPLQVAGGMVVGNLFTGVGTVVVSAGTLTKVNGTNTKFTQQVQVNDNIFIAGNKRTVSAVNSDTQLTVSSAFSGALGSQSYTIRPFAEIALNGEIFMIKKDGVVADANFRALFYIEDDNGQAAFFGYAPNQNLFNLYASKGSIQLTAVEANANINLVPATTGYLKCTRVYGTNNTSGTRDVSVISDGTLGYTTSTQKVKKEIKSFKTQEKSRQINYRNILNIESKSFKYDENKVKILDSDKDKIEIGFIAEDLHEQGLSNLVYYGENGEIEGFAYSRIPIYHHEIIKDHEQEIKDLKTKNEELEQRIKKLEDLILKK